MTDHNHKLCLFFIAHGNHSKHEVDEVERAKEDDDGEEDHMDRTSCRHHLKQVDGGDDKDCVLEMGFDDDIGKQVDKHHFASIKSDKTVLD